MVMIISPFAKNNNSFFNPAARKKRIFPSKSPLHFADYRGESVISSYYISAPRPQARSVEQPPQTVPTASTTSAVRVQTANPNTPCQCAKRKFYPLVPRPPPEQWHGCGYCYRIECTVGEAGLRFAKASSLYRHGAVHGFGCSQQVFCNASGVCIDRHILYDCSAGTAEERRPRSKGAAPSSTADLMQNLPRISKQFQSMQKIPTKKPTVQKPCKPRFFGVI